LTSEGKREYRGIAARFNYLGLDRSDLQYATKEICQEMSKPTAGGKRKIKQAARYLVGAPRLVWKFGEVEEEIAWIYVMVDSRLGGRLDN
jgi:hypothetical protein